MRKPSIALFLLLFLNLLFANSGFIFCQSLQPFVAASNPTGTFELPAVLGNKFFYVSTSATTGKELWVSDGTPEGCQLVKDIYTSTGGSNPHDLMAVGNTLFFWATDGIHGDKLWMTNGTEAGTQMVTDQSPNGYGTTLYKRNIGNRLIISTTSLNNQRYLFSVDQGGVVTKLSPVVQGNSCLVNFNEKLLLFQNTDSLFLFNETFTGKTLVKTGVRIYFPNYEPIGTTLGNKYIFSGTTGANNYEPWVTDGTTAGTTMLMDIATSSSFPGQFTTFNGQVYFTVQSGPVGSELYITDGTVNGTSLVKNINLQNNGATGSFPNTFSIVGDSLFFLASDGFFGEELYVTAGTEQSTKRVTDIYPGANPGTLNNLTSFQGKLFFRQSYDSVTVRNNGILSKMKILNATGTSTFNVVGNYLLIPINYGFTRIFPNLSLGTYTNNSINFTNSFFQFGNRIFGLYSTNKMFTILEADLVSTAKEIASEDLVIFPNPVQDKLNFKSGSVSFSQYVISDLFGRRLIPPKPIGEGQYVDVSGLVPGIYWIELTGTEFRKMIKFSKN